MNKLSNVVLYCFFLLLFHSVLGQEKAIKGVVTAASDGSPLAGASVIIKNSSQGTMTDFDGFFTMNASVNDVLVISFIGMEEKEITITSETETLSIALEDSTTSLNEVVITALGIKRERKALTYAAQEVGGEDLTTVKQTNPINSLSGKSAGVVITRSASGAGGAAKVVLRGNSSTTNNDPLYVIDGIPMSNNGNGSNGDGGLYGSVSGNRDGGDVMSMINPDDIENITVLKGASAAALYGSQGANGVILITTKTGKEGKIAVNFSSSFTVDNVMSLPKLQSEYASPSVGQAIAENGNVADPQSWGDKTDGLTNDFESFFNTGFTAIQSVAVTAGNEKYTTYFSYANTLSNGVIPENKMIRNNVTLRETTKLFDDKISLSASVNLSDQRIDNRPSNGLYSNPLTGLYLHPVGIDREIYKNQFEYFNAETNMMDQYATSFDGNIQQNPYWIIHRNPKKDVAQRVFASAQLKYQITDEFSLQSRTSYDKSFFTFDHRMYGGTDPVLAPATGRYILEKTENTQQYIDLIANYNADFTDKVSFTGLLGASLTKYATGDKITLDSGSSNGLKYPNYFSISNFEETLFLQQSATNKEVQSVFGSVNIGFDDKYFLDLTGRTDWSSTLVNTDSKYFFYPSVGLTGVLSDIFDLPTAISFAKVRGSYAEVGKDIPAYATIPLGSIPSGQNNYSGPSTGVKVGETLRPEKQQSYEFGTEWRFLGNRIGLDFTYYFSRTTDQIFYITAESNVEGYTRNIVNAGELTNEGVELAINATPVKLDNFTWETIVNFAQNKNKVISVHPQLDGNEAVLTGAGVNGYSYSLVEGEDFGSIKAQSVIRNEDGLAIVTDDNGNLTLESTDFETVAYAQPDFTLGWKNNFNYKDFTFGFLIDAKVGGDVISVTEAVNDLYGVSQATADARNNNGGMIDVIDTNGVEKQMTAQDYYTKIGGRAGLLGEYIYDATNVSLREVSLGYNMAFKDSFINNLRLSLIANNLLFIYKKAPFDPNIASSTGIGLQGIDIYGQPSTRSIGFNVNINF